MYTNNTDVSFKQLERHLRDMDFQTIHVSTEDFSIKSLISNFANYLPDFSSKLRMVSYDFTNKLESLGVISRALSDKKGTVKVAVNVKPYAVFSKVIVPTPENFKGSYLEYSSLLEELSKDIYDTEYKIVNEYQVMLSVFISNKDSKLSMFLKEKDFFDNVKKYRENATTKISHFFPVVNGNSISTVKNVINNNSEIVSLVDIISNISEAHSKFNVKNLVEKSRQCAELIDIIIDNINSGKYESVSPDAIQALAYGAYEVAKYIEFVSLFFYKVSVMINMTNILVDKLTGVKE